MVLLQLQGCGLAHHGVALRVGIPLAAGRCWNVVGQSNRESVLDVIQVSESGENSRTDVKME